MKYIWDERKLKRLEKEVVRYLKVRIKSIMILMGMVQRIILI